MTSEIKEKSVNEVGSNNADKNQVKSKRPCLQVTLVRSPIRQKPRHRLCIKGLGLRRLHQTVLVNDTPSVRGMVNKIGYMVKVEVVV